MKKMIFAVLFALVAAVPSQAAASDYDDDLPAADVAEQGSDFYDKAKGYVELRDALGAIPNPGKKLKIGFVCKAFENEFWRLCRDGALNAAEEMRKAGLDIEMDARSAQGETDETGQLAIMSTMVNRRYDIILLSPISDGNLLPAVEKAKERGIMMAVVNDSFMPQIENTVCANHYEAGLLAAEWMSSKIGEGEVAIITGTPRNSAARSRTEGFKKWFADNNPNIKVVDSQNGDWDRMKAKDITDVLLKKFPNLKGIYCNNDTMAMGSIEAVKSAGRVGSCLVIGTDGTSEAYESIRNGELSATVNNLPYYLPQIALEVLLRKMGGQEVPKVVYSPQMVADRDNIGDNVEESIGWKGFSFK